MEVAINAHMNIGDTFTDILESNPTTGYRWSIVDSKSLSIQDEYIPPAYGNLVGSGGFHRWRVTPTNPGTYSFVLIYSRPFETDVAPVKVRYYTLNVY